MTLSWHDFEFKACLKMEEDIWRPTFRAVRHQSLASSNHQTSEELFETRLNASIINVSERRECKEEKTCKEMNDRSKLIKLVEQDARWLEIKSINLRFS